MLFLWLAFSTLLSQESNASLTNPFASDADILRGQRNYMAQCAACHGADGKGGNAGPALNTGVFKHASSDEALFQVINKGIPGTVMPGSSLNPVPIWQLVAYIRSLSADRAKSVPGADAARGEQIYAEQRCHSCHQLDGPDLAAIGARRTPAELRKSIVEPEADVAPEWWRFRITTRLGRIINGYRLNEDTFSIQYRDEGGHLRSILRSEIRQIEEIKTSPMPSFAGKLSDTDLNHLVAYLLKKGAN
jgi:putative heme-binding domain-containing protein